MNSIKILAFVSFFAMFTLVGCNKNSVAFEQDYYVQIEGNGEKTNNDSQYVYNLKGYNENGNEKVVSFFVDEMLEEGTLLVVPRSLEGYTGDAKVIEHDKLPKEIKKKFNIADK